MKNNYEHTPIAIDQKISDSQMMQLFALAHQEGALFVALATQHDAGEERVSVSLTPSVRIIFDAWMQQVVEKAPLDPDALLAQKSRACAEMIAGANNDASGRYHDALLAFFLDEYKTRRQLVGSEPGESLKMAS